MNWEHFEIKQTGQCKLLRNETGEKLDANYQIGIITTGKSRVFWGYQIIVSLFGEEFVGRSKGYSETYYLALKDCNTKLSQVGLKLLVAGNTQDYSESAMSGGAGYGYLDGQKDAVHIMSDCDDVLTEDSQFT